MNRDKGYSRLTKYLITEHNIPPHQWISMDSGNSNLYHRTVEIADAGDFCMPLNKS